MCVLHARQWRFSRTFLGRVGFGQPDVGGAVSSRVADFVRKDRAAWLLSKVYEEIRIQFKSTVNDVHVDLQHHGPFPEENDQTMDAKINPLYTNGISLRFDTINL